MRRRFSLARLVRSLSVAVAGVLAAAPSAAQDVVIDSELPSYEEVARRSGDVGGDLRAVGSDTMLNLMQLWGRELRKYHPAVQPQVEGKGSSTAPPALEENQAQFGPMSREMDPSEVDRFVEAFGYEPTELRVAIDCVAIFVHRDNPIESITLGQLERAFTVAGGDLTWKDLGVTAPRFRDRPVSLYGRNSASGTYKFFKEVACGGSDFKPTVKENPGSAGVVNAVSRDIYGIGYSGIGYRTPDVRLVPVAYESGETPALPTPEAAYSGEYPLARFLYVYTNRDPREPVDPLRAAMARLIFSREGQEAVVKDGAFPVSADLARVELEKLGLEPGF